MSGPMKPILDSRLDGRREFEQRRADEQIGTILPDITVEPLLDGGRRVLARQFDQHVREIRLRSERRTGQIVAGRRAAHRNRDGPDRGLVAEPPIEPGRLTLHVADIIAVGQKAVGAEIGLVEVGEKVLGHDAHRVQRAGEQRQHDGRHRIAPTDQRSEQTVEAAVESPGIRVARNGSRAVPEGCSYRTAASATARAPSSASARWRARRTAA